MKLLLMVKLAGRKGTYQRFMKAWCHNLSPQSKAPPQEPWQAKCLCPLAQPSSKRFILHYGVNLALFLEAGATNYSPHSSLKDN